MKNEPTKKERDAARKLIALFDEHGTDLSTENVAYAIADARPEPSPDAEKLARDIAVAVIGDHLHPTEEEISGVASLSLPLLTKFRPVTVDVEACAKKICKFLGASTTGISYPAQRVCGHGDFIEIISRHFTDTPKSTKTQEEWAWRLRDFRNRLGILITKPNVINGIFSPDKLTGEHYRITPDANGKLDDLWMDMFEPFSSLPAPQETDYQKEYSYLVRIIRAYLAITPRQQGSNQQITQRRVMEDAVYLFNKPLGDEPKPLPGDSRKEYAEFYPEMGDEPKVEGDVGEFLKELLEVTDEPPTHPYDFSLINKAASTIESLSEENITLIKQHNKDMEFCSHVARKSPEHLRLEQENKSLSADKKEAYRCVQLFQEKFEKWHSLGVEYKKKLAASEEKWCEHFRASVDDYARANSGLTKKLAASEKRVGDLDKGVWFKNDNEAVRFYMKPWLE